MGRRDARRVYVGKAKGAHAVTQGEINALIVGEAREGRRVVRLKSGDPLIYGRAGEEIAALRTAGISFDIVPGITAAFAAAAETEIPLTLRESSSSLVFVTGHDADGETLPGWAGLALTGTTVAVYMGRSVAARVAARLIESGLASSTPVAVIENASRSDPLSGLMVLET
jgi:uroporphyrin-III C-methyltransferase/precorrin-2 dehydrogenase/sirohydrochlorin ferrochelatase